MNAMDDLAKDTFADSGAAYVLIGFVEGEGKGSVEDLAFEGYSSEEYATSETKGTKFEILCSLGADLKANVKIFKPEESTGEKPSVIEIVAVDAVSPPAKEKKKTKK